MKKKILIIGFGRIGFYHLQALERFKSNILIYIYDIKNINKKILQNKNIISLKNLKVNQNFDLVIISTSSEERYKVFYQLTKYNRVKKIIFEKFIYFKNSEFLKTSQILRKKKIKAWVNCMRREIDVMSNIKSQLSNKFEMIYKNSRWGLGCNSIHFLDLFIFFSKRKNIKISKYHLDKKIYNSKRKGYVEFKGKILFDNDGSKLLIEDNPKNKKKIFIIKTKNKLFSFSKFENILTIKNLINNSVKKFNSEKPNVSELSYKIIKKLINNKKIKLSTFEDTMVPHKLLINLFSKHCNIVNSKKNFKIT